MDHGRVNEAEFFCRTNGKACKLRTFLRMSDVRHSLCPTRILRFETDLEEGQADCGHVPGLGLDTTVAEPRLISGGEYGNVSRTASETQLSGEALAEQGSVGRKEALRVFGAAAHASASAR